MRAKSLRCLFGHKWSKWLPHSAYGNRDYRYCLVCGKAQERKV